MKKIVFLACVWATVLLASCDKGEIEYIFGEQPEERIAEKLDELKSALLSAQYGWKGALNTTVQGGYGFYMDFKEDETVDMLSDYNATARSEVKTSTYRVRWGMDATLVFDTYNYITILQDPNPSVNGGTGGQGLQSDIEFEYVRITQDSIILKGKRYQNELILTKLSQESQQRYLAGQYQSDIAAIDEYFATHQNNYIEIDAIGTMVEVIPNASSKLFVFQYSSDEGAKSVTYKYNYELGGINFNVPLIVGDVYFVGGELKNGNFYLYDTEGKEYLVQQNSTPIMPMESLFAYNGVYKNLYIGSALPAGIVSGFNAVYQASVTKFAAMSPTRTLVDVMFTLTSSTTATVRTRNNNGTTTYTANATFNYTYEDGVITLSNPGYDGNWTARVTQLIDIQNYFLSGPFRVDYVVSSDPSVNNIGGLYRVEDETSFFYGALQ